MSKTRLSIFIALSLLFHVAFATLLIFWTKGWFEKRPFPDGVAGGPILLINVGGREGKGSGQGKDQKEVSEEKKIASIPKAKIGEAIPLRKKEGVLPVEKEPRPVVPVPPSDRTVGQEGSSQIGMKGGLEPSGEGGSPPGGTGGKGGTGGPNILSEIRRKIERAKRYPSLARLRQVEGVVALSFRIGEGGGVSDLRLLGSSGSPLLDEEALATVRRAAPLPFYPDTIRISLRFKLESE